MGADRVRLCVQALLFSIVGPIVGAVLLCNLLNAIRAGTVSQKVSKSPMPFPQRENVKAFIDGARLLGVPDAENFDTGDLFDGSNMKQVMICLHSLGRRAKVRPTAL